MSSADLWARRQSPPSPPPPHGFRPRPKGGRGHGPAPGRAAGLAGTGGQPHAGGIDARAAAVGEDRACHQLEVRRPPLQLVLAEEHLAEARAVDLHPRIAAPWADRGRVAEQQRALAAQQDLGGAGVIGGIERERRPGTTRRRQRREQAQRRPGLVAPGLERQPDAQRRRRQPQPVHSRRVAGQHGAQDVGQALEVRLGACLVTAGLPVAVQGRRRQTAGEAVDDLGHPGQRGAQLLAVVARQRPRDAGGRRHVAQVAVRRLRLAVEPDDEVACREQRRRPPADRQPLVERQLGKLGKLRQPRRRRHGEIAGDQAGVGLADLGHRLAAGHVVEPRHRQAAVRHPGAPHGQVPATHQYTPTTTELSSAPSRRTLRTPSQGSSAAGAARSASSRSRKRGMKNSRVKVVSITLPVSS